MRFLDFTFAVLLVLIGTMILVGLSACGSATGDDGRANVCEKEVSCGATITPAAPPIKTGGAS